MGCFAMDKDVEKAQQGTPSHSKRVCVFVSTIIIAALLVALWFFLFSFNQDSQTPEVGGAKQPPVNDLEATMASTTTTRTNSTTHYTTKNPTQSTIRTSKAPSPASNFSTEGEFSSSPSSSLSSLYFLHLFLAARPLPQPHHHQPHHHQPQEQQHLACLVVGEPHLILSCC
eukprot:m.209297 g.209297  ORF g.209297 m.209297 type:complete len:171 (-) comp26099_c1_seq1:5131-5643(-)